jgi:hypothetical protein
LKLENRLLGTANAILAHSDLFAYIYIWPKLEVRAMAVWVLITTRAVG